MHMAIPMRSAVFKLSDLISIQSFFQKKFLGLWKTLQDSKKDSADHSTIVTGKMALDDTADSKLQDALSILRAEL